VNEAGLQRLADRAHAAAKADEHAVAAGLFEDLAVAAGPRVLVVHQATVLAAEAWRKAEQPMRALAAARAGRGAAGAQGVIARLTEAGSLLELGRLTEAEAALQEALDAAEVEALRTLALDAGCGIALARGDVETAQARADELSQTAPPAARPAVAFRTAALRRLAGDLLAADALLAGVEEAAQGNPAWRGPHAAALHERAELALLTGQAELAVTRFRAAEAAWAAARRTGPGGLARSGQVRAGLLARHPPPPGFLDADLSAARLAGASLRFADLQVVRGLLRAAHGISGASSDLEAGIQAFSRMGARLREGRARLRRRKAGIILGDLARTRVCLEGDAVWLSRVPAD
jgi:hypothetical protein